MPRRPMLRLLLLWLSGAALRLTILAVPPVIPALRADLGLSATSIGLLSGLPVLLFAVAALPGALLIVRLGSRTALVGGLFLAAIGAALRAAGEGAAPLYAATIVMGAGVAIMQPSMPALTREWMPQRIGFATAVYSNGLLVGEILPVWLATPMLAFLGGSWRLELAIWALPVLLIGMLVLALGPATSAGTKGARLAAWWPDWRDPLLWRLGLLFGSINATYFATNAFLPAYLGATGRGALVSAALTALNLAQLPTSLVMLAIVGRLERRAFPYLAASIAMAAGVIGLVTLGGIWVVAAAALLGCAGAAALILGLTLPPLLSGRESVGRVSAAMFSISYASAMLVALACGALWDATHAPRAAFLPIGLATVSLGMSALALKARRQLR